MNENRKESVKTKTEQKKIDGDENCEGEEWTYIWNGSWQTTLQLR